MTGCVYPRLARSDHIRRRRRARRSASSTSDAVRTRSRSFPFRFQVARRNGGPRRRGSHDRHTGLATLDEGDRAIPRRPPWLGPSPFVAKGESSAKRRVHDRVRGSSDRVVRGDRDDLSVTTTPLWEGLSPTRPCSATDAVRASGCQIAFTRPCGTNAQRFPPDSRRSPRPSRIRAARTGLGRASHRREGRRTRSLFGCETEPGPSADPERGLTGSDLWFRPDEMVCRSIARSEFSDA